MGAEHVVLANKNGAVTAHVTYTHTHHVLALSLSHTHTHTHTHTQNEVGVGGVGRGVGGGLPPVTSRPPSQSALLSTQYSQQKPLFRGELTNVLFSFRFPGTLGVSHHYVSFGGRLGQEETVVS